MPKDAAATVKIFPFEQKINCRHFRGVGFLAWAKLKRMAFGVT